MSAEPTFARVVSTDLYWLDPTAPITGFLAGSDAALGAAPTLPQTWADTDGIYLLLGQPVTDAAAFLTQLQAYLSTFRPDTQPRILWILDPEDPYLTWNLQELFVAPGATAGTWTVAQRVDFDFADYTLIVSGGGSVAPGELGDAGWGLIFADVGSTPALTFYTTDGQVGAAPQTSLLSLEGGAAGCWRARFDMVAPGDGPDAFDQLDCAIRYFIARPVTDEIHAINFNVLTQPSTTALSLYANLDPQRPLDRGRTHLGFFSWTTPGNAPVLHSGYATARGYGVDLTPQVASTVAPAARLVFGVAPFYPGAAGPSGYYLTPDGGFALTVVQAEADADGDFDRLICGASALEYLGLPSGGGASIQFIGGQPAYAQPATPTTPADLTNLGTTAWLYAQGGPAQTIRYYAQPEDAPYYTAIGAGAPEDGSGPAFLNFLEVPATHLAAPTPGVGFPMAPFRNLASDMLVDALKIEQMALAPKRRAILAAVAAGHSVEAAAPPVDPPAVATIGVTPQGLAVGIAADGETWLWSALGQTAQNAAVPDLRFTSVKGALKQALLTNNLFMVLGDAATFQAAGSVEYQLTALDLAVIGALPFDDGVPPQVLTNVSNFMTTNDFPLYNDLNEFQGDLGRASPGITADQMLVFQRYAGLLSPKVDDWVFQLSPDNWTVPGRRGQTNSYVIYKFNLGRSLQDMAADVSAWTWREAAHPGGDPKAASHDILEVIRIAAGRDDSTGLYRAFNRVVSDPSWTGILALSVTVPLDQLPAPLQPLAAGIDPKAFYAHHLGIAATPYDLVSGKIDFRRSTLFGLIDYENPEDQYFSEEIAYAFRVLQLSVGFQNSVVTTFASRIELMVNRLFGAPARLFPSVHGNNIILTGAHQVQTLPDGSKHDTYVFAMTEENTFQVDGLVLQTVEILSTDMVTAQAASPTAGPTVTATFRMAGNLRFYEPERFDPFCWGPGVGADGAPQDGYLRFGALSINMSFSLANPIDTTVFRLNDGNLSFDLANSVARDNALVRRFPVRLATLITTTDPKLVQPPTTGAVAPVTPDGLGFVSVSAPIDQSVLTQPWYGLNYTIDLGTLGALAGSAGISLSVLAAWSPGPAGEIPAVYVGVRLPGTKDAFGVSLPLQGILKLGFRTIEFLVDNEVGKPRTYTLRLRDFALRFLGLAFPTGHNDVVLFGNPDQTAGDKVGWYAAYSQENDPKRGGQTSSRRILRQARAVTRALPPSTGATS